MKESRSGMELIMRAWIIYFREGAKYNKQYIQMFQEEGRKLGVEVELILVEELDFGVLNNQLSILVNNKRKPLPDFVISRVIYPLLNKQLELMGIEVFNNSFVSEICNDKAKTYQYLASTGIKMVDSCFYRSYQVGSQLKKIDSPRVIKSVDGHGGSQVFLVDSTENSNDESTDDRKRILKRLGGSDVVIQPLTGSSHQDLRVYVIGKEIVGSVLRTAKEGFKSNFSLGGSVTLYTLMEQEKQLINLIIDRFDFGLVGIDFIIGDQGELIFNEIEDVVGSRMLYQCAPEINIVERYLKFIINRIYG